MIAIGSLFVSVILSLGALVLLQPEWIFSALREHSPEVMYSIDTQERVIALTIDDGPDAVHTPRILDLLQQYGVKATFFLIASRISGNEAILERMAAEGHELANHLMYDEPSIRLAPDEFESQLLQADAALQPYSDLRWFRPGSGWYDEGMLATLQRHGYRTALGSIYPYDPQVASAWFSSHYVLWKARPGAIIVLHDYAVRGGRTVAALETILPELIAQGYRFITLSELEALRSSP